MAVRILKKIVITSSFRFGKKTGKKPLIEATLYKIGCDLRGWKTKKNKKNITKMQREIELPNQHKIEIWI